MLTALHQAGVEVVSPTFMNTRALTGEPILPDSDSAKSAARRAAREAPVVASAPEEIAFDKADEAAMAELRGDGSTDLDAERVDEESRRQQAGVDVLVESDKK